jgi:nondiscriminating glutamyl-tRNA synthetase
MIERKMLMNTRVRFAPSPTGFVHIGSLRTALYNYLFAKNQGGKYLIRVEDTDRTRLVEGAVEGMIKSMNWAGVTHDEGPFIDENHNIYQVGDYGPYIQSERLPIYQEHVKTLLQNGNAYRCFCSRERLENLREEQKENGQTPRYDGHCRHLSHSQIKEKMENGEDYVIRMALPHNMDVTFQDIVRGDVTFNTQDLDDQVLIKQDGFPTYHFAVVIDDHFMNITHVIRGEEWLSSTPKHVLLYEFFGWEMPKYVHLPNILNTEKKKLSKRHGDVAVEDFSKKGYLPEALINYIALVGWSPKTDQEIFSMDELIENFSLERVSKSGGVFDVAKLNFINNHYLKEANLDRLTDLALEYEELKGLDRVFVRDVIGLVREKLNYLKELVDYIKEYTGDNITFENDEAKALVDNEISKELLKQFVNKLKNLETFSSENINLTIKELSKELNIKGKNLFMPLRIGISGNMHGSDLVETIRILGVDLIEKRVHNILSYL